MTEELKRQLLEIAEKELAMAQVKVIKDVFGELDTVKEALEIAKSHIGLAEKENARDKELIFTLRQSVTDDTALADRESAVSLRERTCDLNDVRLRCEIEKRALSVSMFETVFRNVMVKRTLLRNTDKSYTDPNGMFRSDTVVENEEETESEEG